MSDAPQCASGSGAQRPVWRYLWAAPNSLAGLLLAAIACCTGASVRRIDGTLEVAGGRLARLVARPPRLFRFSAITFGHVILGLDHALLARVRAHEQVHVRQYERWGPLFIPLYLASSLLEALRGRDPYHANQFEQQARRVGG
jgi:hypothetical protein